MSGKTSETCAAANKRQDNKLKKLLHQVGDLFEFAESFVNNVHACIAGCIGHTNFKSIFLTLIHYFRETRKDLGTYKYIWVQELIDA
jgi:hypothetical protein